MQDLSVLSERHQKVLLKVHSWSRTWAGLDIHLHADDFIGLGRLKGAREYGREGGAWGWGACCWCKQCQITCGSVQLGGMAGLIQRSVESDWLQPGSSFVRAFSGSSRHVFRMIGNLFRNSENYRSVIEYRTAKYFSWARPFIALMCGFLCIYRHYDSIETHQL